MTTTAPPTTAPRRKDEVEAEALAVIDGFNAAYAECLEAPDACDERRTFQQYGSLSTPVVAGPLRAIASNREDGEYVLDGDAHIRAVESVTVTEDLDAVTVVTCEIDPVVVVRDIEGQQHIVNDDVSRRRETYELVRLVDGRWLIGPSETTVDLTADDVPLCEELNASGAAPPWLGPEGDVQKAGTVQTTLPATSNLDNPDQIKDELRERTTNLRNEVDRCMDQIDTCDMESIGERYSLAGTEITDRYPERVQEFREKQYRYADIINTNTSVMDTVASNPNGTIVTITECYTDEDEILSLATDPPQPLNLEIQRAIFTYQWVNLANRGWVIISADKKVIDDEEQPPPCFD